MKALTVEEHKQYALNILVEVDKFCKQHGIVYFLGYGTLIGAIRHQGFIPWDDDIDIHMPREDYKRFLDLFAKTNQVGYLTLADPYDADTKHTFAKVYDNRTVKIETGIRYKNGDWRGVDVDIFPLDGQPDDLDEYMAMLKAKHRWFNRFDYIGKDLAACSFKGKCYALAMKGFCRLFGITKQKCMQKADEINAPYPYSSSAMVGSTASSFQSAKNRCRRECYASAVAVPFEGFSFPVPIGYDELLRGIYGDYMTPPPEGERITHHENNVYLKEE